MSSVRAPDLASTEFCESVSWFMLELQASRGRPSRPYMAIS